MSKGAWFGLSLLSRMNMNVTWPEGSSPCSLWAIKYTLAHGIPNLSAAWLASSGIGVAPAGSLLFAFTLRNLGVAALGGLPRARMERASYPVDGWAGFLDSAPVGSATVIRGRGGAGATHRFGSIAL